MELRIFICAVVGAAILRFAPGLLLRVMLVLPRERVAVAARLLRSSSSVFRVRPEDSLGEPVSLPVKALLISSTLLALVALVTTILEWHPAALMLLLR